MADHDLTERTRALVHQLYDRFRHGDLDGVGALFADDIEWHIEGPSDVFRFCGPRKGRESAISTLRSLVEDYEHLVHEPRFILADGSRACIFARAEIRHRESGRVASADLCDLIEFSEGKVIWFRELFDTLSAAEMVAGPDVRARAGGESGR